MSDITCGQLFSTLASQLFPPGRVSSLLEDAPDVAFGTYAIGFMSGQAEKVYSGVCQAFMSRPSPAWWNWGLEAMALVCRHYGLCLVADEGRGEIWGCDKTAEERLRMIMNGIPNTPEWHVQRAALCGIPALRIDPYYHERTGHGMRCEPEVLS